MNHFSARLQRAEDSLSSVVIRTLKASGAASIEMQEVHPAEDAVRARFLDRIAYFELDIQAALRNELERLLGIVLAIHPAPYADVTHDELLSWLHHRAWCVYRGGNNVLELSDDFVQAAYEENEAHVGRTQGTEPRSREELHEITMLKISQGAAKMEHKRPEWHAVLLAERVDQSIRRVEADVQRLFGPLVGELRAELAPRNA